MIDMSTCQVIIMHVNDPKITTFHIKLQSPPKCQYLMGFHQFLLISTHYDHLTSAHIDHVVPLECSTMFEMCSGCMDYLVTIGVCRNRSPFKSFCAQYALLVRSVPQHFLQTLSETQIPWFWALFETPQMSLIQLPAPVENFL